MKKRGVMLMASRKAVGEMFVSTLDSQKQDARKSYALRSQLGETQHRVVMKADSPEARALAEHDAGLVLMGEGFLGMLRGGGL